jgi:oxygen-independent coproporphyrinogen-3 oxidase
MRSELAAKYDLRVPRYTSYPTAPHFSAAIGAERYGQWLSRLAPDAQLSLYLHIAYCAEMCWFCGCHTKITKRYAPVADYMDCLGREIAMVASRLPGRMSVRHVHFGGGSPTILTPGDFVATVARLRRRFAVAPEAEIAVELDPRTADEEYVKAMAASGVTRVSIGVQDFDPAVQQAVNRLQPYEVTAGVTALLRQHGIAAINLDLMYGLPGQTAESVVANINRAVGLQPRRIALFGYAHVPWMKKHQRLIAEADLPDLAERWRQYDAASARLIQHGYVPIGLDHFAAADDDLAQALAEGRLRRNFQGYTTDGAGVLIGFGASAIGSLPQGYVANETGIHAYKTTIRAGRLATVRGFALAEDDCLRRALIERLMCELKLDVEAVCRRFGADPARFDDELDGLAGMEADGLLVRQGRRIALTEQGRPLVRAACTVFDTYLRAGEVRHAKAV